jgi:hypothetical protein
MEKTLRTILLIICLILFIGMSNFLLWLYPNAQYQINGVINPDYEYAEFLKHYYLEERLNEVLFCLLFLYAFLKSTGIRKGLACFGFVVTFASVVDKVFFGIYHYLSTDILMLIFASIIGYVAYKRQ